MFETAACHGKGCVLLKDEPVVSEMESPSDAADGHCPVARLISTDLTSGWTRMKSFSRESVMNCTPTRSCTRADPAKTELFSLLGKTELHICASIFENISDINCVSLWSVQT